MGAVFPAIFTLVFFALAFMAWRRYRWAGAKGPRQEDTCPYSLKDVFGDDHLVSAPHQRGIRWLTEVFSRSAEKFPDFTALQIPHTGESLTFAELDARAERVAAALCPYLTGPDQVVAVAMSQDNWQIVACHLGVLKAGGTLMFVDVALPEALITHMLDDAQPVVVLTLGQARFGDLPTVDVLALSRTSTVGRSRREPPTWLDDPTQRLATIFYTSGTTGMPKGVECPHAGYVNLALSYADYFGLIPNLDATSLTSSMGYDGSISEMYSAWVSGCAVVMLTREQVRSGPDLVPVLREAEVTVFFCPPALLTTLTTTPEIDLPYPICRYVVPAGEVFPSSLVEPWTRGRRQVINTYGPTEASTDTSRETLRPGEPVTIGSPFPNVTYVVLEVGQLRPLHHGEVGELCIGGPHVARGYRNLPEETAQKFITHPRFGRLYRSGDRCRIDIKTQRVHFFGRIDAQLKVRGHRVEPQAVEIMLQSELSEIEAVVLDYQNEELVAFIVAPSVCDDAIEALTPAPVEWSARVTAKLAERFPAPSIPTRLFLVGGFAMSPVSGKIDRKRLPNLTHWLNGAVAHAESSGRNSLAGVQADVEPLAAAPAIDPKCEEVLAICRAVLVTPLGVDDRFIDVGADSIGIARMAQQLHAAGWTVSVRALLTDVDTARKVAERPSMLQQASETPQVPAISNRHGHERDEAAAVVLPTGTFTTLQVIFGFLVYSPALAVVLGGLALAETGTFFTNASLGEFVIAGLVAYPLVLLLPFVTLLWIGLLKLCVGIAIFKNEVTPGVYPKWSVMHLRVWCIGRLQDTALLSVRSVYRSAPLMAFTLRRLGATVGQNLQCAHDTSLSGPLELLSIADDVAIQSGAFVHTTRWFGQELHIGPVRLESGCKIGMRAAIANDVTVGSGSWVTPLTPIFGDVGSQQMWEGAPARLVGRVTELNRTASASRYTRPFWLLESLNVLMQILLDCALVWVPTSAILWFARGFIPAGGGEIGSAYFDVTPLFEIVWSLTLYSFIAAWTSVVVISLLSCLFIRWTAFRPGLYPSRGLRGALLMYRVKMMNAIQRRWTWTITGQYLRALAGVRFSRVGASECDLMINLVPELATSDAEVFWSHGCYTNMLDYGAEHLELRQLAMPRKFFVGNNCVAEHGHFPTNFLLGVSTPASEIRFRRRMWSRVAEPTTVAGNPPLRLASTSFESENDTHRAPNFPLFLSRFFLNDLFSIGILPIAEVLVFANLYVCATRLGSHPVVGALVALILTELVLILLCVAIKKLLVGSEWGSNHTTPFWSLKHFTYFFAQDCYFVWCGRVLKFSAGTIFANPILRWMGCRIGHRALVSQPLQCLDWNAISLGNDCVMDGHLQLHTLESMTLRVKLAHIRDRSAVAFGATVMGGAVLEQDTTLSPLSLVLKEMNLATGTYEGSPAEPACGSSRAPHQLLGESQSC